MSINVVSLQEKIAKAIVAESESAWGAGIQNCAGPISRETAEFIAQQVLQSEGLLPRSCQCGSGQPWDVCSAQDSCCG